MNFKVMSEREIENYNCEDEHVIISIRSPNRIRAKIHAKHYYPFKVLYLKFHDLSTLNISNGRLFSVLDAQRIKIFVKDNVDYVKTIICQCEAGISRSAGVAGALSKWLNGDDNDIFKRYLPNMYVYNLLLKVLMKGTTC